MSNPVPTMDYPVKCDMCGEEYQPDDMRLIEDEWVYCLNCAELAFPQDPGREYDAWVDQQLLEGK